MKILLVHNRYRSTAPSGENRVVDQESEALAAAGHDVRHFERHSDEIEDWPAWKKATLPARVVWNPASRRDLGRDLRRHRPDVVHIHNTFPLLSPSVLYACRGPGVPVVITLHNYKLLCASGDFFRDGEVCHDCAGGNPAAGVIHRCYRGSALATATTVLNTRSHRGQLARTRVGVHLHLRVAAPADGGHGLRSGSDVRQAQHRAVRRTVRTEPGASGDVRRPARHGQGRSAADEGLGRVSGDRGGRRAAAGDRRWRADARRGDLLGRRPAVGRASWADQQACTSSS